MKYIVVETPWSVELVKSKSKDVRHLTKDYLSDVVDVRKDIITTSFVNKKTFDKLVKRKGTYIEEDEGAIKEKRR